MKVFDVEVLAFDDENDCHIVRYCIDGGAGVVRRSVATYSDGRLSRDSDKPELAEKIEELLAYKTKNM